MGLIAELLGNLRSGAKPAPGRTIADVESALSRLAGERRAAREAVATAMRQRDELLLVDETDEKIAELDAIGDRYRLTLERCEKAEPILLAELESLRSDAKQARYRALVARSDAALEEYLRLFRAAVEGGEVLAQIRGEAHGGGFAAEFASVLPAEPRMINRASLTFLEAEVDRRRDAAQAKPPRAATVSPPPKPAASASAKPAKPATAKPAAAPAPRPPPREPFEPKPGPDGLFQVRIMRSGFELADGSRPKINDVVALPRDQAFAIVQRAVGEFEEFLR